MRLYRTPVVVAVLVAVMATAPPAQANQQQSIKKQDQAQVQEIASATLPTFFIGNVEPTHVVWLAQDPVAGSTARTTQVGMMQVARMNSPDNLPILGKEVWAISASRTASIAPAPTGQITVDFAKSVLLSPLTRASPVVSHSISVNNGAHLQINNSAETGTRHVRRELTR